MPLQTILLIDYDPVTVEYTRSSLMEAGYAVEVAADGISGLECFERIRPDLVVVEAMIPKKHGFEVCRTIKDSSAERQAVPVVITTSSFSGRKHRNEAIDTYGCDEYLEKPIGKQRLVSICRGLLEGPAVDSEDAAAPGSLPDLDEMSEDQLTAELDRLVPDVEEEEADAPLVATDTPDGVTNVHDPGAPAAEVVEGPTEAALARLSELTEEEIISRLDTVLTKRASDAGLDRIVPPAPVDSMSEPETETAAEPPGDGAEIEEPAVEPLGADEPGDGDPEIDEPAVELHGGDERPVLVEPSVAPRGADDAAGEDRELSTRADRAPAARPSTAAVEAARVESTASSGRPALKWLGIAAAVLILVAAGWFGLTWLGNGTPGERGADSSNSASFTPSRQPATRAAVPSPVDAGEPAGWLTQDLGPSASDAVDVAALETPTTSVPPVVLAGDRAPTGVDDTMAQPRTPRPQTTQPRPRTTTRIPESKPAVQVAREIPAPIAAQAGPSETAVVRPAPPGSDRNDAATDPAATDAGSTGSVLVASARPGDPGDTSLGLETPPAAEALETETPDVEQDDPLAVFAVDPLNIMSPAPARRSAAAEQEPAVPDPPKVTAGSLLPIEEVDSTPVIVTRTQPSYHPFARRLKQQGTVELRLLIDEEGRVAEVEFIRGIPTSRLNDEAVKAARSWTFEPAMKDGVPVRVWIPARVDFRL